MSTVYQFPNSSTPETASSYNQQNNDFQVTLSKVRRGQTVYVAVDSNRLNESFTIRVNEVLSGATRKPSLLTLLDGIPQVQLIFNISSKVDYQRSSQIGIYLIYVCVLAGG